MTDQLNLMIDYWLERASSSSYSNGKEWYPTTKEWCYEVHKEYHKTATFEQVVGILAALSPLKEFSYNQKLVIDFLECNTCGHLTNQVKKCRLILSFFNDQGIMNVLNGRKTKSFYHNIVYPNQSPLLTIDSRIWQHFRDRSWENITNKRWDLMEKVFQERAKKENLSVSALQAILWVTVKENKNNYENLHH